MCNNLAALCVGLLALTGCSTLTASGDFASGRQALLTNREQDAVGYFQSVANTKPDYVMVYDLFREGIWTYLGRTQYGTGQYEPARQSLQRALERDPEDNLARLYLGLTLRRLNDESGGLKDIQAGLQGLYNWLDYMQKSRPYPALWDPTSQIRNEISRDLEMISGKDIDWQKLLESAEWVGRQMEEELERVKRDEEMLRRRGFPPGTGGVGFGIGF
jgi:tetratricopeptide (TPR) repeat protein